MLERVCGSWFHCWYKALLPGLAPEIEGLHKDEPAEHEAMGAFPHAGHAVETGEDKTGQVREGDHHGQDHLRTRCTEKKLALDVITAPSFSVALILHTLRDEGVDSEYRYLEVT